uniref:Transposase n=1 Tax=Ascaris lumbricoides TaxID=6252 RepID=A0A0M3I4C8_ASCLU
MEQHRYFQFPYEGLQWEPLLYRQFRTAHNLSPASVDTFEAAVKRERPSAGYGWEQCEFSPMSCLLRRRRRVIDSQQSRMA